MEMQWSIGNRFAVEFQDSSEGRRRRHSIHRQRWIERVLLPLYNSTMLLFIPWLQRQKKKYYIFKPLLSCCGGGPAPLSLVFFSHRPVSHPPRRDRFLVYFASAPFVPATGLNTALHYHL